tara:strand:+ start:209 stop:1042 length:834 start_codon:yes stop_codon:yes gene_type:complete
MKKIVLGFIAFGLLTLAGCEKDDETDMDTTEKTETSDGDGRTDSDKGDDITDTSSDEGTDSDEETIKDEITDEDGNVYGSVTIGTQIWMSENLKTSKYSDGTSIPNVTDGVEWGELETGAWCHYENNSDYNDTHGKLYNFYAVETQKLCPTGWHVPTHDEWTVLTDYLSANGHSGKEGKALKSVSGWHDEEDGTSGNGTDNYGWNGLPRGHRASMTFSDDVSFEFDGADSASIWWSSSLDDSEEPWRYTLMHDSDSLIGSSFFSPVEAGLYIRCLKD